jgi:hypothetical protein
MNQQDIQQKGSGQYVLSFDLSYLKKSGKATDGAGNYRTRCRHRGRSGTAQRPLWGLEAGFLSVIAIGHHTAFHREVFQTPAKAEREAILPPWTIIRKLSYGIRKLSYGLVPR